MIEKTCCFTGHRNIPPVDTDSIRQRLIQTIDGLYAESITTYYVGGAQGFDALAAEAVVERRTVLSNLRLIVVVPHDGHTSRWSTEEQARYEHIEKNADDVFSLATHYFRGCMQIRNRYMVDRSSVCVCYLTEPKGGTFNTVKYATQRGLRIYNLANLT